MIPDNCAEVRAMHWPSGHYVIDQGTGHSYGPFRVYCDIGETRALTLISNNLSNTSRFDLPCTTSGCIKGNVIMCYSLLYVF